MSSLANSFRKDFNASSGFGKGLFVVAAIGLVAACVVVTEVVYEEAQDLKRSVAERRILMEKAPEISLSTPVEIGKAVCGVRNAGEKVLVTDLVGHPAKIVCPVAPTPENK